MTEPDSLILHIRSRVEALRASGEWEPLSLQKTFVIPETALLICDMWDKHWCAGTSRRIDALARKMAPLIDHARSRGIQIIHAPSETMSFYRGTPQRKSALAIDHLVPSQTRSRLADPPLPITRGPGGCETPGSHEHKAWTRQHAALRIKRNDVISDSGIEIYSLLRQRGIKNLIFLGVHSNVCILNRPFGIKQMTNWGIACVLVRDLTDVWYDPKDPPFVTREEGAQLVIQHIEKYWCPTVLSHQLADAFRLDT